MKPIQRMVLDETQMRGIRGGDAGDYTRTVLPGSFIEGSRDFQYIQYLAVKEGLRDAQKQMDQIEAGLPTLEPVRIVV